MAGPSTPMLSDLQASLAASSSPRRVTIDAAWFPHLLDSIVDYSYNSPLTSPLALRAVSRTWRDRIDRAIAQRLVLSTCPNGIDIQVAVVPAFSTLQSDEPIFSASSPTSEVIQSPDRASTERLLTIGKVIDVAGPIDPSCLSALVPRNTAIQTLRLRTNGLGPIPLYHFVPTTLVLWHDPSVDPTADYSYGTETDKPRVQKEAVNVPLGNVLETLAFCSSRVRHTQSCELVFHFGRWGGNYVRVDTLNNLQQGLSAAAIRRSDLSVTVVGLDTKQSPTRSSSPAPDVHFASAKARTRAPICGAASMDAVAASEPRDIRFIPSYEYVELVGEEAFKLETFL